jgi:hypothetical protein
VSILTVDEAPFYFFDEALLHNGWTVKTLITIHGVMYIPSNESQETHMDTQHLQSLQQKHAAIDRKIHEEQQRPAPDAYRISSLKKQKLRLKEEITH